MQLACAVSASAAYIGRPPGSLRLVVVAPARTRGASRPEGRVGRVIDPAELEAERQLALRARTGDRVALGALLEKHG